MLNYSIYAISNVFITISVFWMDRMPMMTYQILLPVAIVCLCLIVCLTLPFNFRMKQQLTL